MDIRQRGGRGWGDGTRGLGRVCVHACLCASWVAGSARVRDHAHVRVNEKVRAAWTCDSGVGEARRREGCRCCESGVPVGEGMPRWMRRCKGDRHARALV